MDTSSYATRAILRQDHAKALGAFYTDARAAEFIAWWAIRSPQDTVMDPSFGAGVFLEAACRRTIELGGRPAHSVFGVEIDPRVHSQVSRQLRTQYQLVPRNLLLKDFFELDSPPTQALDAVIGNPPFIRYQRFSGDTRKRALNRARESGVPLSNLTSSWAPFVIHAVSMIRPGGRLAMVVPFEIGHAAYARPVLEYILKSFGAVTLLTFHERLFPELNEDTMLLLGEGKGSTSTELLWREVPGPDHLPQIQRTETLPLHATIGIDGAPLSEGRSRLIEYFIPSRARELYRALRHTAATHSLGELADVGIGYVTGDNGFFHLSPQEVGLWNIPGTFLRPAVKRGRALRGLRFTYEDLLQSLDSGEAAYLLYIPPGAELPESVQRYLTDGEHRGVDEAYKCRSRSPWYSVPHVHEPQAFLSYMSGTTPRLVANDAGAVAPNTLHVVRIRLQNSVTADILSALWQTSLTQLSVEIEGHALGGGMLKLEPTEAENVVVPRCQLPNGSLMELAAELDAMIRSNENVAARARADKVLLQDAMGLTASECELLESAARILRARRQKRTSRG
ncbi:MAG: N-6 DNA methylase [Chloroflexota bacterium]